MAIGQEKSQGLIGLHNFTGADWGGKFVGVSKKTWINKYLALDATDPIVNSFRMLGTGTLSSNCLLDGELPDEVKPLENFVRSVYSSTGPKTLPDLRWELFRLKNLEGEKLPPTRGALLPHIMQANYISMRDKMYTTSHPNLPPLEDNGWLLEEGKYMPAKCLNEPPPQAVLELVKCGCHTSCVRNTCSCKKNSLPCTALCKCTDCSNWSDYKLMDEDNDT